MIKDKNIPDYKISVMFELDTDSLPLCKPLANTLHHTNKFSEKERLKKVANIDLIEESIKIKQISEKMLPKIKDWMANFLISFDPSIFESHVEKIDIYLKQNKQINSPTIIRSMNDSLCLYFFDIGDIILLVSVFRNYNVSPPIKKQKFILLGLIVNSIIEKNKLIDSLIIGVHSFHSDEKDKIDLFEKNNISSNLLFFCIPSYSFCEEHEIIGSILYGITNNYLKSKNTKFIIA